jgi:hypothetical protein
MSTYSRPQYALSLNGSYLRFLTNLISVIYRDNKSLFDLMSSSSGSSSSGSDRSSDNQGSHLQTEQQLTSGQGQGQSRDRFGDASNDIMLHLSDKVVNMIRKPAFQERIQSILDPIVNHVINRVFPYIVLSSILFIILILVTVSTFIIVMRSSLLAIQEGSSRGAAAAAAIDKTMMSTGFPVDW